MINQPEDGVESAAPLTGDDTVEVVAPEAAASSEDVPLVGSESIDADSPSDIGAEGVGDDDSGDEDSGGEGDGAIEDNSGPNSQESLEEEAPRQWYILKVQSNREDSIRDALTRRVKVEGLDEYFGDIIVPTESVTEFKSGKKKVVKRKLYPGYIVVNMVINDDTWFLVRETPGIGDFTGAAGKPSPMLPHEVDRIIVKEKADEETAPTFNIAFDSGDRVKITEGTFENFEGDVDTIDSANGRVTVMINIFGRSTPVELEYWQLEAV